MFAIGIVTHITEKSCGRTSPAAVPTKVDLHVHRITWSAITARNNSEAENERKMNCAME